MPMHKLFFLTTALIIIALGTAPFAGHTMPQSDGAAFAQAQTGQPANLNTTQTSDKETPTDATFVLYRVMGVVLVVWIGLAVYLFSIDRKITRLQKEVRGRR
jgi:CcmD family protein